MRQTPNCRTDKRTDSSDFIGRSVGQVPIKKDKNNVNRFLLMLGGFEYFLQLPSVQKHINPSIFFIFFIFYFLLLLLFFFRLENNHY